MEPAQLNYRADKRSAAVSSPKVAMHQSYCSAFIIEEKDAYLFFKLVPILCNNVSQNLLDFV
jgi:hypothetical protein